MGFEDSGFVKTCDKLVIGQQLESHISPTFPLSKEIEAFRAETIIRLIYNNISNLP